MLSEPMFEPSGQEKSTFDSLDLFLVLSQGVKYDTRYLLSAEANDQDKSLP
jgi:hypothetical protein